ncbi:hypothetical protein ACJX0J_035022, partial [Zea mays]
VELVLHFCIANATLVFYILCCQNIGQKIQGKAFAFSGSDLFGFIRPKLSGKLLPS